MKLEKFRIGNKKKVTIVSIIILIFILMLGIIIYQSYALYENKKTFNILNGTVPTFGTVTNTVELAYTVNGKINNKPFPNKDDGYNVKSVTCDNGVTAGWDEESWSLININSNNNTKIKCTIDFIKKNIYGIERELASTSSAWTRIDASVGKVANAQVGTAAVQNDFDSIYPWSDIKSYNYNTSTKKITAWYGESGFKFDGSNGEVLTYIPEFYYKREQDETKEYIYISKEYIVGYTKSEAFSVGRYTISGSASGVHSKSGVSPFTNTTIANYRTYARNLGDGFGQMDYHYFIIQMLYLVEYADYNSQAKLGPGNANNTNIVKSGGCDILGMHSGSRDGTDKTSMIYRGIEDIYGNIWQFVDGINIKDNQTYICYDQSKYESNKFDGCYQKIGYVNATNNGYISKLGYDSVNPLVAFPIEASGSDSTYISDSYYQNTGEEIVVVGGSWYNKLNAGLWDWGLDVDFSWVYTNAGARFIKINT